MPNWCYSKYVFYKCTEDESELIRLHRTLSDILTPSETDKGSDPSWLGNVAIKHGFDWKELSCRGTIDHLDEYVLGSGSFMLESETAWAPTDDLWEAVVAQYDGIAFVYVAEEPGMEIFINTDISSAYFSERYLLDISSYDYIPNGWHVRHEDYRAEGSEGSEGYDRSDVADRSDRSDKFDKFDESGKSYWQNQDKPKGLDVREYFKDFDKLKDYCTELTGQIFSTFNEISNYFEEIVDKNDCLFAGVYEFSAA